MAHRIKRRWREGIALAIIVLLCSAVLVRRPAPRVEAAPPLAHAAPLPLDPDWPAVYLILQTKCVACHRPQTENSDFTSYEKLIEAESLGEPVIVPGDPEGSLLCEYIGWNALSEPDSDLPSRPEMPVDRHEWLTTGQQEIISRWIRNGALEYSLPEGCDIRPLTEIDFPSAKQCAVCHPSQYEQWSRSMHHYAQHSPVFEAFNLTLIERTGGTIGTFCSRCHTQIGTALGEDGSVRNVNRTRISMEGVSCIVCHRRGEAHYKSNSRAPLDFGTITEGCVYGPFEDSQSAEAGSHESVANPYIRTSQFCGECHDVTSPGGVRLEEAFSEWQNSPAARENITCQECHMGPVPGVPCPIDARPLGRVATVPGVDPERFQIRPLSDHTFAGPDYSLLPDTEFPEKLDWMYEVDYRDYDRLTPYQQRTLTELRVRNRRQLQLADQARYQLLTNAAEISVEVPHSMQVGRGANLHVDVTSLVAGHSFPTGFTAERQLWVEVVVRDPVGQIVFVSGDFDDNGDLRDEHSHAVAAGNVEADRFLLNFQNKFVALSNKGTVVSVVLSVNRHPLPISFVRPSTVLAESHGRSPRLRVAKGSLPPLATRGRNYPLHLDQCGPHSVEVRLNFRHLPPTLLDHIGIPHLKDQIETVVIDEFRGCVEVMP